MDYADVAQMFGVGKHYMRRVFNGTVAASLPQLEWLAAALGHEFSVSLVPTTEWDGMDSEPTHP